jgi:polar amino acid transport system substrate-binding protein
VNQEAAIRDMAGDRNLYAHLLKVYLQDLRLLPTQLAGLLDSGKRDEALRLVHTLKGTSATVGAMAFSAQARLLEQEIKRPDSDLVCLAQMPDFLNELQRTEKSMVSVYETMTSPV